jgi:hypothetical protein
MRKSRGWAHQVANITEQELLALPFWEMHYAMYDASSVIIQGHHFRVGPEKSGPFRGFGGTPFTIKFYDGRVVTTRNLWQQGEIDEAYREWLPDNAEFEGQPFTWCK